MKSVSFSKRTKQLIGSMSQINQSLLFLPGQDQATWSATRGSKGASIMVKTKLKEEIPCQFGIGDLTKFLNILSLFEEPKIVITENVLIISSNDGRAYELVLTPANSIYSPNVDIDLDDENIVEFNLPMDILENLSRTLSMANLSHVKFVGDGKIISIIGCIHDNNNKSSDIYAIKLLPSDKIFNVIFKTEKIQTLMENTYRVIISDGRVSFVGPDIIYFVCPEADSTFN